MRTGELAEWLDKSTATIKNWTVEFSDYLSEDAQGGDKHRDFTEQDVRIMLLINLLRDKNTAYDDIKVTLGELQAGEWSGLPQLPERPPGIGPVELMPVSEHEASVNLEKQRLLREIAIREDQITNLETSLAGERTAHSETREKLMEAREELGELRGKLTATDDKMKAVETATGQQVATLTAERERERRLYLYVIAGLAVAAVVVVVLVLVLSGGGA